MTVIETQRLLLNKITIADAPFYLELMNSLAWLANIGDRNVRNIVDAKNYIKKNYLPSYDKYGFGSYIVVTKDKGYSIGACGLYKRENLDHPDIGFAFLPDYMGKGYGYEASQAVMDYAKNNLGQEEILGFTLPNNLASIGLLEKIGLKNIGTYTFKNENEELLLFSNKNKEI